MTQHDGREPAEAPEATAGSPPEVTEETDAAPGSPPEVAEETDAAPGSPPEAAEESDASPGVEVDADPASAGDPPAGSTDPAGSDDAVRAAAEPTPEQDELTLAQMALAERTADLQRLQAEFLNYKRRVDRDRDLTRQNATYLVLTPIIDVLDNIDRAREHGPLDEGFRAVAEQLERVVTGLGLTKFGEPGDQFDPTVHEALSHIGEDPEVTVPTAKVVAKAGYKIGDRVVRAAQVLVADPVGE